MKQRKPGAMPGRVVDPHRFGDIRRSRFARNLTKSVFGKNYWDDEMTAEIIADQQRKSEKQ